MRFYRDIPRDKRIQEYIENELKPHDIEVCEVLKTLIANSLPPDYRNLEVKIDKNNIQDEIESLDWMM